MGNLEWAKPAIIGLSLCAASPAFGIDIFVDDDGPNDPAPFDSAISDPLEDGSAAHPFDEINEAIAAANESDAVVVQPGDYFELVDLLGKVITLRSTNPESPSVAAITVIDATGLSGSAITCTNNETPATMILGFTIRGGAGTPHNVGGIGIVPVGGGMFNNNSAPTVAFCTFQENSATRGGGVYNTNSDATFFDCSFLLNTAANGGGGVFNHSSDPTFLDCWFLDNQAVATGGGMSNSFSAPTLERCRFFANVLTGKNGSGGAVRNSFGSPTMIDCNIAGNTAVDGGGIANDLNVQPILTNCVLQFNVAENGGAMYNSSNSDPIFTNCTITNNTADIGGGLYNRDDSGPIFVNTLIWANSAPIDANVHNILGSVPSFAHCDVQGSGGSDSWNSALGTDNGGNIDADPLMLSTGELTSGSPCVDHGDGDAPQLLGVTVDLLGADRFVDDPTVLNATKASPIDIGAYELQRRCAGDFAGPDAPPAQPDGVIDLFDLLLLLSQWSQDGSADIAADPEGKDLTDGVVDLFDLLLLLSEWGDCAE